MKELFVYWRKIGSEVVEKTFIVAENEEAACNKVELIKGKNEIEILYTKDADRSKKIKEENKI